MGKVGIALPVALSALTGYVLFAGYVDARGWWLCLGVFFMACSSGVINHWQERDTDALMPRTKNRPIPAGKMSDKSALVFAGVLAVCGSLVLYYFSPAIALVLSWVTLLLYNLIYTPLKRVTSFAVVSGSLVGALPPVIGWAGAGGNLASEVILLVAAFFFIGQIPHFWLLLLMFGDQYQMAKLPCLNRLLSESQIKRVTFTWVLTTLASAFLVIFFVIGNKLIMFLLLSYVFYLLSSMTMALFFQKEMKVRPAFYKLNFLYLFMMIFLILDSLIRS